MTTMQPPKTLDPAHLRQLQLLTSDMRKRILHMITTAKSGHPGGSLSAIDIIATLFLHRMHFDPIHYASLTQDVFVLSKGHGVPALYVVLQHVGLIPSTLSLDTLRTLGSPLQGHPDRVMLPEVVASTGSLGQGLSIAIGIALAKKINRDPHHVFVLTGDGELQEGQIWEAIMFAAKYKVDNLTVYVDRNYGQIDGHTEDIMPLEHLDAKFSAFNWEVTTIDGHDFVAICETAHRQVTERPFCVIANTVKGRGVKFMEHDVKWHGVAPTSEELQKAITDIENDARAFL